MDSGSDVKGKKKSKSKSAAEGSSSSAPPVKNTPNTKDAGADEVPKDTPNNVAPKAVPAAAAQNAAAIYNYVPFHSEDLYDAILNLGRTTTVDDCWSIFSGVNSETGSPLEYEEFVRMLRNRR